MHKNAPRNGRGIFPLKRKGEGNMANKAESM